MQRRKKGDPFFEFSDQPNSATETELQRMPQRKKDLKLRGEMTIATKREEASPVISIAAVTQPICAWDNPKTNVKFSFYRFMTLRSVKNISLDLKFDTEQKDSRFH